jgi:hypothetical protein
MLPASFTTSLLCIDAVKPVCERLLSDLLFQVLSPHNRRPEWPLLSLEYMRDDTGFFRDPARTSVVVAVAIPLRILSTLAFRSRCRRRTQLVRCRYSSQERNIGSERREDSDRWQDSKRTVIDDKAVIG